MTSPPPSPPLALSQRDCAYGLARYAAIAQNAGLVPIVEPEVSRTPSPLSSYQNNNLQRLNLHLAV